MVNREKNGAENLARLKQSFLVTYVGNQLLYFAVTHTEQSLLFVVCLLIIAWIPAKKW